MVFGEYEKPTQSKDRGVGWLLVNQNRVVCLAAHNVHVGNNKVTLSTIMWSDNLLLLFFWRWVK